MFKKKKKNKTIPHNNSVIEDKDTTSDDPCKLKIKIEDNIKIFKEIFSDDDTFIIRQIQNKYLKSAKCCLIYIEGMVDNDLQNENIIQPLLYNNLKEQISEDNLFSDLQHKVIIANGVKESKNIDGLVNSIIQGDTVLILDGHDEALIITSKGWQTRSIDEPESEKVVRGPREGFTESIALNKTLIRRKINNPDLKFKNKEIGTRTHTQICICYIESLASEKILKELYERLDKIEIDGILDSGYIQELIKDSPYSPFETVGTTERPDVLAGKLLEGRIGILVDGTPFVLTVPFILIEYFQTNEDYYNNYIFSSINRILRIVGGLLSICVPAIYVSLVTYNQEMIPTSLILSISAARDGLPFPTIIETLLMLLVFEILREAGTRIPIPIGQTISIVGALVLGQAVVEARLISAPIVIVTSLTGISSLLIANLIGASILIRTAFLILSSFLGMYGLVFGIVGLIIYLMGMRSYGIPYMSSILTINKQDLSDTIIRSPWWQMKLRPKLIGAKNYIRQVNKKQR